MEWLPLALSIGISEHDFWNMTMRQLNIHIKAHEMKMKILDQQVWAFCGVYVLSAVGVAVEHCLAGKDAKSEYVQSPITQNKEVIEKKEITEEERIKMENYKLAMTLKIMQANFELNRDKE